MFYYEEFPIPEISDITGKPVGTIKSLLHTGAACSTRRDRPSKAQSQVNIYHVVDGAYLLKIAERAREGNDPVKALAYYDKFISEYPDDEKIPDALYWSASLLPDNQSFVAVIFPSSMWTTRSHNVIDEIPEEALSKEERLLEICTMYPDHWSAPDATHQLAVCTIQVIREKHRQPH